jgi:hypothetical protein
MFFTRTWLALLASSIFWIALVVMWMRSSPPFVGDVREFDAEIAASLHDSYVRVAAKIRNLWLLGGILALLAYV